MKKFIWGAVLGFLVGISGSVWSHLSYRDAIGLEFKEALREKFKEALRENRIPQEDWARMQRALDELVARARETGISQRELQAIQQALVHGIHGCDVVGFANVDRYRIECPIH